MRVRAFGPLDKGHAPRVAPTRPAKPPEPEVSDMSIPAGPPKDYTALAIIGTILSACTSCIGLITGIIAIVQNNKAKSLYAAGDVAGAYSAANTAKILLIVTWVLVAIGLLFSGGLWFTGNYPGLGG